MVDISDRTFIITGGGGRRADCLVAGLDQLVSRSTKLCAELLPGRGLLPVRWQFLGGGSGKEVKLSSSTSPEHFGFSILLPRFDNNGDGFL